MPEFVLVLTSSHHVRILAESLEEAKRFAAHADTDDLSALSRCDSYFDWTLEVLEPDDPTFSWADGKTRYRLDGGSLEEDACEVCRYQPAVDSWGVSWPLTGHQREYRMCPACLKLAVDLPALETEDAVDEAISRLRVQAVEAIRQRQIEDRERWEREKDRR